MTIRQKERTKKRETTRRSGLPVSPETTPRHRSITGRGKRMAICGSRSGSALQKPSRSRQQGQRRRLPLLSALSTHSIYSLPAAPPRTASINSDQPPPAFARDISGIPEVTTTVLSSLVCPNGLAIGRKNTSPVSGEKVAQAGIVFPACRWYLRCLWTRDRNSSRPFRPGRFGKNGRTTAGMVPMAGVTKWNRN